MPEPGSNRGYKAWHYIEPILFMLIGGGRHIEELREIIEVAGKVVKHARKLCLKIYAEVEKFILYKKIRLRHAELSG